MIDHEAFIVLKTLDGSSVTARVVSHSDPENFRPGSAFVCADRDGTMTYFPWSVIKMLVIHDLSQGQPVPQLEEES